MSYEQVQEVEIKNYGCIRQQSFALTPLHCLIGPNDSGKSTLLHAVRLAAQLVAGKFEKPDNTWKPFSPFLYAEPRSVVSLHYGGGLTYRILGFPERDPKTREPAAGAHLQEKVVVEGKPTEPDGTAARSPTSPGILSAGRTISATTLSAFVTRPTMVRFDPNMLRASSPYILTEEPIQFQDETGLGLSGVYQALNSRDVDTFVKIRDEVKKLFPQVKDLRVPSGARDKVVLEAKLTDDTIVPATAFSEGLLYFLGFRALQHVEGTKLFLVEEPENGLHPARIAEVMAILRELSKTSQILIATHSPLVVNELEGNEVTVITRDPKKGTQGTLIKDVPGFDKAAEVYALGEFWLSYADGNMEEPLLKGLPRK